MRKKRAAPETISRDIISLCEVWMAGNITNHDFRQSYQATLKEHRLPEGEASKFKNAFDMALEMGEAVDQAINDLEVVQEGDNKSPTFLRAYFFSKHVKSVKPVLFAAALYDRK